MTKKFVIIPDTQCKPGIPLDYLGWIGEYIVEQKPDTIVHLGDHWDMPSLSSWDKGKRSFEGRRYKADIEAGNDGWAILSTQIKNESYRLARNKKKQWDPDCHFLLGNHEQRIERATQTQAEYEGIIGYQDLGVSQDPMWTVHPFLKSVVLDGIAFSHYFTTGLAGRPAATANAQLNKQHMSCIAGHQQGIQIATAYKGDGCRITSVIAGSAYTHQEDYLGKQGNNHWRGILVLHEVKDGQFDLMPVSMTYLEKKYG